MRRFQCSFFLILVGIGAVAAHSPIPYGRNKFIPYGQMTPMNAMVVAVSVCVLPMTFVWATTAIAHRRKPLRLFEEQGTGFLRPVVLAVFAAGLAVIATTLVLTPLASFPQRRYSGGLWLGVLANSPFFVLVVEPFVFATSSGLFTWILLRMFGGRRRPGCCVQCGYDISASLDFGRCPECGRALAG